MGDDPAHGAIAELVLLVVVWLAGFTGQWSRLAIPFRAATLGLLLVAVAVIRGRDDLVDARGTGLAACVPPGEVS